MRFLLAMLMLACFVGNAEARKSRRVNLSPVPVTGAMVDDRYPNLRLPEAYGSARAHRTYAKHSRRHIRRQIAQRKPLVRQSRAVATTAHPEPIRVTSDHAPAVIGGRPAGCPHRFCGCALSLKLFGRIIPMLNLAANWMGFPHVTPAPGMVAARRGHVFQLLAHRGGSRWRVWDANSGHGRIRIHDRSIAGYAIVNPNSSMSARRHVRRHRARQS